jgi:hypothetical protein
MELTTILNQCYPQPGYVYQKARFRADRKAIEVPLRPRQGSKAVCSGCDKPAPGYDTLPARLFEFIPFWGFVVFLIYARRRVQSRPPGAGSVLLNSGDALLDKPTPPESDGLPHDSHGLGNLLIRLTRGGHQDNLCALHQSCGKGAATREGFQIVL